VARAIAGGLAWFFLVLEPPPEKNNKEKVLIQQIKDVITGEFPKMHIYGRTLS
jgi:hypothetical protein